LISTHHHATLWSPHIPQRSVAIRRLEVLLEGLEDRPAPLAVLGVARDLVHVPVARGTPHENEPDRQSSIQSVSMQHSAQAIMHVVAPNRGLRAECCSYQNDSMASGLRIYSLVSVIVRSIFICFTRSGAIPVGCCAYICARQNTQSSLHILDLACLVLQSKLKGRRQEPERVVCALARPNA